MNTETSFDYAVIGGGSAGYNSAAVAAKMGLRTVVIEGGAEVGGLCILRGCMPSKTLLESARRAEVIRDASEFGLRAEYQGANATEIRDRKRRLIQEFAEYRQGQLEGGRFVFIRGRAVFVDPHTVEIECMDGSRQRITAKTFLIATGSTIDWHKIPGLREASPLSSDDVLDSDDLPKSVIILGGGATALEFASYYQGIGSLVTVIQRSAQILKGADGDVAEVLTEAMRKKGVRIETGTQMMSVEHGSGVKRVLFRQDGVEQIAEAEEIVYALGRKPGTEEMGLERVGVELSRSGAIVTNAQQQSTVPHIFAAGDVCGPWEVVHIAIQQGENAARNAAKLLRDSPEPLAEMDDALKLFAIFTQPELAWAGVTSREAFERGLEIEQATYLFADHGKSMVRGETDGFVKLIVERTTRRILGAAVVGPEASELIHEIVVAMAFGATAGQLARIPHFHPTLSEIWTYPAEELAED